MEKTGDKVSSDALKKYIKNFKCFSCGYEGDLESHLKTASDESMFQGVEVICPKCGQKSYYPLFLGY